MRNALLKRIRPLVERLARDLVDAAVERIEAELAQVETALEVGLSAFASEVTYAATDRADHDPLPHVRGGARPGLRAEEPDRRDGDADAGGAHAPGPSAAPPTGQGRAIGQPATRLVEPRAVVEDNDRRTVRALDAEHAADQGPVCSKCKQPGHNARSCGRAPKGNRRTPAPTFTPRDQPAPSLRPELGPADRPLSAIADAPRTRTPYDIAAAKARIAARASASQPAPPQPRASEREDDNPNARVRWSGAQIAEATELAEGLKRDGELPEPRSSWVF